VPELFASCGVGTSHGVLSVARVLSVMKKKVAFVEWVLTIERHGDLISISGNFSAAADPNR
jgi:hypothetical protein